MSGAFCQISERSHISWGLPALTRRPRSAAPCCEERMSISVMDSSSSVAPARFERGASSGASVEKPQSTGGIADAKDENSSWYLARIIGLHWETKLSPRGSISGI